MRPLGSGLFIADNEHSLLKVLSSPEEHELYFKKSQKLILYIQQLIVNKKLVPIWQSKNHMLLKISE